MWLHLERDHACIHALNTAQHAPSSAKNQLEANFFLGIGFFNHTEGVRMASENIY